MANEIPISVVDRKIKVGRHVPATMTNIGKDYLSISLDDEWSSTDHRLRVTLYSESPYVSVQEWWDGKSAIEIPQEITSCPAFKITVANVSEDGYERLVTQAMDEPIENPRNGHDEGAEPGVRTMDIIARIDALAADLEEKRDTDYWRGEPGPPGEPGAPGEPGNDGTPGYSPTASVTKNGGTATITITDKNGTTTATVSDGAPGAPGAPGEPGAPGAPGYSPTANVTKDGGTATITVTDKNGTTTATVSDGAPGEPGADGKSAYQYAQDSGYTGTETEFSKKLASDVMVVKVGQSDGVWSADKTYSDIMNALMSGTSVFVRSSSFFLPFVMSDDYSDKDTYVVFASTSVSNYNGEAGINTNAFMIGKDGRVMNASSWIDIPTDDHINSLIDAKLGVIENGSY